MAETTQISWCDSTFNPWIGCTEVSVGEKGACVACYARTEAARRGWAKWGNEPRHRTSEGYWRQPLTWNRKAAKTGLPHFVFCASLADVFDNQVDPAWRRDLFDLIRATPHLTWLLLTKRPQNILKLFREISRISDPADSLLTVTEGWPSNAAIGCTVVTQAEADRDVLHLLAAKAALKPAFAFLSMEPLMEAVDISRFLRLWECRICEYDSSEARWASKPPLCPICAGDSGSDGAIRWASTHGVNWVIAGGETDQGKFRARPVHPDAFRSLRDQCAAAGVPFHFKQWGEWSSDLGKAYANTARHRFPIPAPHPAFEGLNNTLVVAKIGKKAAGRLLDGIEHNARP